jgi:hypothetical protein
MGDDPLATWEGVARILHVASDEAILTSAVRRACELYLHAGENDRREMRRFFAARYSLQMRLWRVSGEAAIQAERTRSTESMRLALVALSLEDGATDCRDTFLAVGTLSRIAADREIDFDSVISEIAALSSNRIRSLLQTRKLNMHDFGA